MAKVKTIGILGAGKLGIVLAQRAVQAGYTVYISGSKSPERIALTINVLAPGAVAASRRDTAKFADVVILALPLSKYKNIPHEELAGKLVIDATNHWWEVDGPREAVIPADQSSSEAVQELLAGSRVVKAFNHVGYHDLYDEAKPAGSIGRKAVALAGDDDRDSKVVSRIINEFGYDPLYIGSLAEGRVLEPGGPVFGASVSLSELSDLLKV